MDSHASDIGHWLGMTAWGDGGASGTPPPTERTGAAEAKKRNPRVGIVFYYKPIDIVGNMCYHPITYKKDMLKE